MDATVDLALRGERVERAADVVRGGELHHLDLPGGLVDVDERGLRGEAVGGGNVAAQVLVQHGRGRIVERFRDERPSLLAQMARTHHAIVRDAPARLVADEDRSVACVEPVGRRLEMRRRERKQLATQLLGGEPGGVAGDERRAARVGADVPRLDRGVRVHDLDALERDAQRFRHDHREHGLRALADLRRAGDHGHLAEVVELHDGAAAVGAIDPGTAPHVKHPGVADPARPSASWRGHVARDVLGDGVEALRHRAGGDHEALRVRVTRLRQVAPAQLERIEREPARELVHLRLDRERRLEVTVAAHRARVRVVRVRDGRVEAHVRTAIESRHRREHHVRRGGAPRHVGAVVDDDVRVTREQMARGVRRRAQPDAARLARGAGEEFLHAIELELHRPPHAAREQRRDHVDWIEVEPATEVAADRRLHHAHAIARGPERLREIALVQERDLGGRPHGEVASAVPVGDRDHRAQTCRRDEVEPVLRVDDRRGLRERPLDVAVRELVAQRGDVRRHLVVHERRAGLDGRERVEDSRQLLVRDVDQLHGGLRDVARLGSDGGDLITDATDLVPLERELVLRESERPLLDVGRGDHGQDTGQRAGARGVDLHEAGVGEPGAQDGAVRHAGQLEVVEEARAPGDLVGAVLLGRRFADDGELSVLAAELSSARALRGHAFSFIVFSSHRRIR